MSEKRFSLDVIGVAEPCHEDWSDMTGGEQKKFCDSCAKHVHNLSEMSRDEAESFVNDNPTGVCIRFRRDAKSGKMLTAEDRPAPAVAPVPVETVTPPHGRGRFSGPANSRHRRSRPAATRASYRMAGHVFVPFLSAFSLIAGAVAVVFNGGRAPAQGGQGCVMGMIGPPPVQQPRQAAAGVGVAPVALPPAGFLAQAVPDRPVIEPPVLMGRIAPPGHIPQPQPDPEPAPPELMGEIEMIMGDIACPEEPLHAVEPIEAPPQAPEAVPVAPEPDDGARQN